MCTDSLSLFFAEVKAEFARIEPLLGLPYIHHKKRGHFPLIENKKAGIGEKWG